MMNGSHDCVITNMMPKAIIAMASSRLKKMLPRETDRRALEQTEFIFARQLAERDHRTGEGDRAEKGADEQFDAIAERQRIAATSSGILVMSTRLARKAPMPPPTTTPTR